MTSAGVLPRCRAPFASDDEIEVLTAGFLDGTLPAKAWTHDAHWAVSVCLHMRHAGFDLRRDLPGAIRRYNIASGGENTDTAGYHETITKLYVIGIGQFARGCAAADLLVRVNALLASPIAARDWPLRFYSKERLSSVEARRGWVEPDVSPILL